MHSVRFASRRLSLHPGFLLALAAYAALELSFNHHLLDLAGQRHVDAARVHDLEIWARWISGLGLALLLIRWLDRWIRSRAVLVLVCVLLGLSLMWQIQKSVIDAVVARANPQDMRMSVLAHMGTAQALQGRVQLRGQQVLDAPATSALRPVMQALWPASVLGLRPDDVDMTAGASQLSGVWGLDNLSPQQLQQAYRKTVMTPVGLGASLLFGLLNLCQLFAGLSVGLMHCLNFSAKGLRLAGQTPERHPGLERAVMAFWVVLCLGVSWWSGNAWVASAAYAQVALPALWQNQVFLAPFVDWSVRAEPAWSAPVAWVHHVLLQDFAFRVPPALADWLLD